jgi:hypothetical protein
MTLHQFYARHVIKTRYTRNSQSVAIKDVALIQFVHSSWGKFRDRISAPNDIHVVPFDSPDLLAFVGRN